MSKVTSIKDALIQVSSEISINNRDYIGYVLSITDTEITIENYDMLPEKIQVADIEQLCNMDEDIYFFNPESTPDSE